MAQLGTSMGRPRLFIPPELVRSRVRVRGHASLRTSLDVVRTLNSQGSLVNVSPSEFTSDSLALCWLSLSVETIRCTPRETRVSSRRFSGYIFAGEFSARQQAVKLADLRDRTIDSYFFNSSLYPLTDDMDRILQLDEIHVASKMSTEQRD